MNLLFCSWCGKKIPEWMYKSARFCCDKHRKAAWDMLKERSSTEKRIRQLKGVGEKA